MFIYLYLVGSLKMTGALNMDNNRIKNPNDEPQSGTDAINKNYLDSGVRKSYSKPSHKANQFDYLIKNTLEWSDLIYGGNSFNLVNVDDLSPDKGNFHSYSHKVIYTTINKNSLGGYKYKVGIQCFPLTKNIDYTLCVEILNVDYQLWHKSKISIDKATSKGLAIGNVEAKNFCQRYIDSSNNVKYIYYHRRIVNFRKTAADPLYQLHLLVEIPQDGIDLQTCPQTFTENYIIAYGIIGAESDLDEDKIYDYHAAYEIKPTKVKKNVPLDMNGQRILNFNPYVINVWNCHFEKKLNVLNFLCGKEVNTVAKYSNFKIFKITITTKDIFRNTGQYTLSFKRSNHSFNLNNEGINQIDINANNWIIDKNSSLTLVHLRNRRSIMPEEILLLLNVKLPLLQG